MEAAEIMKKIIVLTELKFWPCIICATIKLTPLENSDLKIRFVPETELINVIDKIIEDYDIVVGVGYREVTISQKLIDFREKLLILMPSDDDEELIPCFFAEEFDEENLDLMTAIIEISNGQINKRDIFLDSDPNVLANIMNQPEPSIDELFNYAKNRYDCALKVVRSLYEDPDEIKFHKYFFLELVNAEKEDWIEEVLEKYKPMELETEQLIKKIHPCKKYPGIGLLTAKDPNFFEDDIFEASEQLGYITIAIEYKNENGNFVTIHSEQHSDMMNYIPGRIKENWLEIISSLN